MPEVRIVPPKLEIGKSKKARVRYFCRVLGAYYATKGYAVSREVGLPHFYEVTAGKGRGETKALSKQRADFMAINKAMEVVIVETKSCLADFTSDKKWRNYLEHCGKFYFAADEETAPKIAERLHAEGQDYVGVISISLNPEPLVLLDNMTFLRPAKKRIQLVPTNFLLWQMAARSSGFNRTGNLRNGNVFEDKAQPAELMRVMR